MRPLLRHALSSLLVVAAANASAGVITQDGVVFTSSFTGNVLRLEIDAAKRSGGWTGASAIDGLALKTLGSFSGVSMTSSSGAAWSLAPAELFARGCGSGKAGAGTTGMTRLCYSGAGVALADNMVFTFTFTGTPTLSAPHLKVHFVDAKGSKVGSLLSLDFPAQPASIPVGSQTGTDGGQAGSTGPAPELIPAPVVLPVKDTAAWNNSLPLVPVATDKSSNVPEPQSLALLAAGFAMLGVTRRRRKHQGFNC